MGGAYATLYWADSAYPCGLRGLCGFVFFESVHGGGPCLFPFCPSCRPSPVLLDVSRGSLEILWRSETRAVTFPFGQRPRVRRRLAALAVRALRRGNAWVESWNLRDPKGICRRGACVADPHHPRGRTFRADLGLPVGEGVMPPPSPPAGR